jgi:hypothetical protein
MAGEQDLGKLLATMEPVLKPGEFVFATIDTQTIPDGLHPIGTFREDEGLTVIVPAAEAMRVGLDAGKRMRLITLAVHSSLEAVGLTAAFAAELARHGISANVVAGYYHDHIFIGAADAERAVAALHELSTRHR